MSVILNIETSGSICSATLSQDGTLIEHRIEETPMRHGEVLAPFVEELLEVAARKELKLDAVAVSSGPGSYTGLRIGLSMAKGLCFGLNIPLIMVPSLKILAVKTMFLNRVWEGEELIVPMIDARRMEVYTAVYDFALNEVSAPRPLIVEPDSLREFGERRLLLCGSGSEKTKEVLPAGENIEWVSGKEAIAYDMIALSEKLYRESAFADTAYAVPEFLKSFRTSEPRKKI